MLLTDMVAPTATMGLLLCLITFTNTVASSSECLRSRIACSDILWSGTIWGYNAVGVDVSALTNNQLQWIGNYDTEWISSTDSFYCKDDDDVLEIGTLSPLRPMRALLGPGTFPTTPTSCASTHNPRGICNAPNEPDSVVAFCRQLGFQSGSAVSVQSYGCPAVRMTDISAATWSFDWVGAAGYAQSITCTEPCAAVDPTDTDTAADTEETATKESTHSECVVKDSLAQTACPRIRQSWLEMSDGERSVYIDGFELLQKKGVMQAFSASHSISGEHLDEEFLPWHRHYIFLLEEAFRSLGDLSSSGGHDYTCFALPYWNWADELGKDPTILHSGLGSDGDGFPDFCVRDSAFAVNNYITGQGQCLKRDYDTSCRFSMAPTLMALIDEADYGTFLPLLWKKPHATPHACIGGDMLTYFAPDDPAFYLHHSFIDLVWALWQNVHATDDLADTYSGPVTQCLSYEWLDFPDVAVANTLDLYAQYRATYEKGRFWDIAHVDDLGYDVDDAWFMDLQRVSAPVNADTYDRRRRRLFDQNLQERHRRHGDILMNVLSSHQFDSNRLREIKYPQTREERKENEELRAERTHIVRVWSENSCIDQQAEDGYTCDMPIEGDAWDDCSGDAISEITGDISVSLNEMLGKAGNTRCHNQTIYKYYKWALRSHQLQELCRGCFSDSCTRGFVSGRCGEGAFHSGSAAGMLGEGTASSPFIEVLQEHGNGLLIFGGLTVGAMVVMCVVVVLVLWYTSKRVVQAIDRVETGDGAEDEMTRPLMGGDTKNVKLFDADSDNDEKDEDDMIGREDEREQQLALGMDDLSISTMKEESVSMI